MKTELEKWYRSSVIEFQKSFVTPEDAIFELFEKGIESYLSYEDIRNVYAAFPGEVWYILSQEWYEAGCSGIVSYLSTCERDPNCRSDFEYTLALSALDALVKRDWFRIENRQRIIRQFLEKLIEEQEHDQAEDP